MVSDPSRNVAGSGWAPSPTIHRAIEKKLKAAGLDVSATEALQILRSVRVVDFTMTRGARQRSVTRGTHRAAPILCAVNLTDLDPPTPPGKAETVA